MNYAHDSSAAWPDAHQVALGQQWYALHPPANPMNSALHCAYQQELQPDEPPPLPDEPPPPLPEDPPPVAPQPRQPAAQQQQPSHGVQSSSPHGYSHQLDAYGAAVQHQTLGHWNQTSYPGHPIQQQGWQGQAGGAHQAQFMLLQQQQQRWGYETGMALPPQQAVMGGQQWGSQYHMQQAYMQGSLRQCHFPQQQQHQYQQSQIAQQPLHQSHQQLMGGWHTSQQQQSHQLSLPHMRPGSCGGSMSSQGLHQQQNGAIGQPQPPPPPLRPMVSVTPAAVDADGPVSAPPPQQPSPGAATPAAPQTPVLVDLQHVLLPPGRFQRPKRLLLILRGLPGSGKSHVAKVIRQLEVAHAGTAPRIHSIDDYFMVDVEREVAADTLGALPRSAGSKRRVVVEQEYQHDAAMEASYWRSLMRALGKTLSGGGHSLVLVDAPAPRADQVKEAWLLGESAGYEVMVIDPLTSDPQECYKQNTHHRSFTDIQAMASVFEQPPVMYTRASAVSLLRDAASKNVIDDVDMLVEEEAAEQQQQQAPGVAAAHKSRWSTDHNMIDDQEQQHGKAHTSYLSSAGAGHGGSSSSSPSSVGPGGEVAGDGSSSSSRPSKKPKLSVQLHGNEAGLDIDQEALLAGVNQVLEQLDADVETAVGVSGTKDDTAGGQDVGGGGPTRHSAAVGSMSLGARYSSSAGSKGGILRGVSFPGSVKKKVTWPDLPLEDDQQPSGFRIAPPRQQLEEVHWVDGLGPPKSLWVGGVGTCDDNDDDAQQQAQASVAQATARSASGAAGTRLRAFKHSSFAEQVRAEHKSEHSLFRAILLGQKTNVGVNTRNK